MLVSADIAPTTLLLASKTKRLSFRGKRRRHFIWQPLPGRDTCHVWWCKYRGRHFTGCTQGKRFYFSFLLHSRCVQGHQSTWQSQVITILGYFLLRSPSPSRYSRVSTHQPGLVSGPGPRGRVQRLRGKRRPRRTFQESTFHRRNANVRHCD